MTEPWEFDDVVGQPRIPARPASDRQFTVKDGLLQAGFDLDDIADRHRFVATMRGMGELYATREKWSARRSMVLLSLACACLGAAATSIGASVVTWLGAHLIGTPPPQH